MPYNDFRTNLLAITAQLVLVFSFFSTILLKADMAGEVLTDDRVGNLMVAVNLPIAVFCVGCAPRREGTHVGDGGPRQAGGH